MATLTAKPPTNADVPPKEVLQELRMPPFPKPPTGAKIIPFNEFKPSGIRVSVDELGEEIEPDDETPERDALGIPTIILNVKHTMDTTEKVKRRKKRKLPVVMTAEQAKHKTWWEDWEETERYRQNAHDQKFSPADRLVQAAEDFARGRTMPVTVSGFWDQFRLYTGLLVNPNQAAANDDDEDEDEEEAVPGEESATLGEPPGPRIVEVEVSGARSTSQDTKSKMDTAALLKEDLWADLGSPIAERFLDDPELSIKIFFSSYFRKKGLLYNPLRCVALPILIHFFLRYLVRCKTFQESHLDASIRRALAIAELAKVQLPATSKIGLKLPDEFSGGCGAIWGLKHPLWERTSRPQQDPALAQDVEGQERAQAEIRKRVEEERARREAEDEERFRAEEEERAAKRQKVTSEFESEIKAVEASMAASEPISAGWGETDTTAEGVEAGVSSTDDQPTVNPGGWSTNNGGWDTSTTTGGGWGDSNSTWDMTDVDQKLADAEQAARWHLPDHSLLPLLGPTAFPLTHRTGIVEKSMRRIVEVISPTAGRACRIASGPSAEAVEEELTRRLARIVLEPWPRANLAPDTEINEPTILPSSLGKVNLEAVEGVEGHAPSRDKITLLVEPAVAQLFEPTLLGMGLFATWIQLVRREKEGDKGKTKPRDEFWYMEELLWQIPSYYTDLPEGENEK